MALPSSGLALAVLRLVLQRPAGGEGAGRVTPGLILYDDPLRRGRRSRLLQPVAGVP